MDSFFLRDIIIARAIEIVGWDAIFPIRINVWPPTFVFFVYIFVFIIVSDFQDPVFSISKSSSQEIFDRLIKDMMSSGVLEFFSAEMRAFHN